MNKKWFVHTKKADFDALSRRFGIDPVTARIIRNRDITEYDDIDRFLNGKLSDIESPYDLKYAEEAAFSLMDAIGDGIGIKVIGDYDVDGVCSSFIYLKTLTAVGAECSADIPHRIRDGYGINEALIDKAAEEGYGVILTCDNGIAAYDQVQHAKDLGMYVIVTDHHEVPYTEDSAGNRNYRLPPADIVVDPKREDDSSSFKEICGAVVALKVSEILMDACGMSDNEKKTLMQSLMEAATLATVCDVMPLVSDNRIIVKEGLKMINNTESTGLRALIDACSLSPGSITAYTLGFVLGPCINASGRLEAASEALDLLITEDRERAAGIAAHLRTLNDERKKLTEEGINKAILTVDQQGMGSDMVLCIYIPGIHESVAGIIAGRVRERYSRPVFIFTDSDESDVIKGSGRSIEAYDMYGHITEFGELLTKFGGHKMAAGLSMKRENLSLFRKNMNDNSGLSENDLVEKSYIDVALPISYLSAGLIRELDSLEPFGTGNPRPVFGQKDVCVEFKRFIGKDDKMGKYVVKDDKGQVGLTVFRDAPEFNGFLKEHNNKCTIFYTAQVNEWNGREDVEIILKDYC
ncbi:MAG: single-stranded-DNA-specific exonuclease RecJ [Lachnospiraceae bacterium]|nr:single-stranded-DNA-specific exonuclease RecJ [Lachnospiraceae bacterium]